MCLEKQMMKYTKKAFTSLSKNSDERTKEKNSKEGHCKAFCVKCKRKKEQLPNYYIPEKVFIDFMYLRSFKQQTIRKVSSKAIRKIIRDPQGPDMLIDNSYVFITKYYQFSILQKEEKTSRIIF